MSVFIRRSLTTHFNRLVGYANDTGAIVDDADRGNPPNAGRTRDLKRLRRLIGDIIPKIEAKQAEWERLILAMVAGVPRDEEQQRYDDYEAGGLHFMIFLDNISELMSQADILLGEVDEVAPPADRGRRRSRASRDPSAGSGRSTGLAAAHAAVGGAP